MVRVCVSLLFPLLLLQGCAIGLASIPADPPVEAGTSQAKEASSDCARKNNVIDALTCASKD
jgi:hypothetical protein